MELTEFFAAAYGYHPLTPHSELPAKLPATASALPLAGIIALLSMAMAMGLRLRAARAK